MRHLEYFHLMEWFGFLTIPLLSAAGLGVLPREQEGRLDATESCCRECSDCFLCLCTKQQFKVSGYLGFAGWCVLEGISSSDSMGLLGEFNTHMGTDGETWKWVIWTMSPGVFMSSPSRLLLVSDSVHDIHGQDIRTQQSQGKCSVWGPWHCVSVFCSWHGSVGFIRAWPSTLTTGVVWSVKRPIWESAPTGQRPWFSARKQWNALLRVGS